MLGDLTGHLTLSAGHGGGKLVERSWAWLQWRACSGRLAVGGAQVRQYGVKEAREVV